MKKANDELLCLDHDPHLEKIQDLKWLPWIGIDYFTSDERLLIVGESHYLLPEDNPYYEKNKDEVNSPEKDFTRNVVQTFCIDHKKVQPMFDNLNRCLFGKRDMKKITLDMRKAKWQQLAFYNFVQRPMENNQKRPTGEDLENGWKVFAELIKILQPTECIFIGVAAADSSAGYIVPQQSHPFGWSGVGVWCIFRNGYGRTSGQYTHARCGRNELYRHLAPAVSELL